MGERRVPFTRRRHAKRQLPNRVYRRAPGSASPGMPDPERDDDPAGAADRRSPARLHAAAYGQQRGHRWPEGRDPRPQHDHPVGRRDGDRRTRDRALRPDHGEAPAVTEDVSDPDDLSDLEIVARTVWGEARGEGVDGWVAVASVIKNRAAHPGWWGRDFKSVCLKRAQFSSWNIDDRNRPKMLALATNDPLLTRIRGAVAEVLACTVPDPTGGAPFYHTKAGQPSLGPAITQTTPYRRPAF